MVADTLSKQTPPQQLKAVADATRVVLKVREALLRAGLSLAAQYDSLGDPGVNRLRDAHNRLDDAVLAAYRFSADGDLVAQLLGLNLEVADQEAHGETVTPPGPPEGIQGTRTTNFFVPAPTLDS